MRKQYSKNWISAKQANLLSTIELERQFTLIGYNVPSDLNKEQLIEYGYSNDLIVDFSSRGRKSKSITNQDIINYVRKTLGDMNASDVINTKDINITLSKNNIELFLGTYR